MRKLCAALSLCMFTITANASLLRLTCEGGPALQACAERVQTALTKLGCNIDASQSKCNHFVKPDPQNPNGPNIPADGVYCEVTSENCSQPKKGFGSDSCYSDSELVKLSKSEGIHNGYYYGFFASYSRNICVLK